MPRVHVARAAKDYPRHDIKKGDTYYHWSFFRGPKQMSKTRPRPSQTTGSPNLSQALAAGEAFEDALAAAKSVEDVTSAITDAISAAEEAIEAYEETISNLEEAFSGGCPNLEEAGEKRDALEAWKGELEEAQNDIESPDDDLSEEEALDAAKERAGEPSLDL